LLARVAEESTGAAVRFAPLERGVTDVMELFDHAAPKQDALREAAQAVEAAYFGGFRSDAPSSHALLLAVMLRLQTALATEGGIDG
jgi:hypothetical protein